MPKTQQLQTSFSAGELAAELALRRDTKQYKDGAKSLLNCRVLVGGGNRRRPGSRRLITLTGDARLEEFIVNQTTQYVLAFVDGGMNAYARNTATGLLTAAGSLTGCPWTGATYKTMDIVSSGNTIIVTHPSFLQVVTRIGASSWARAAFPWFTAPSGRIHQPHYKIAELATTMQPSALTGSVTLTLSAPHWDAAHVGKRVRYVGRELEVTAVSSGTVATAVVKEALPPTQTLTLGAAGPSTSGGAPIRDYINATGFLLGEVVQGTVTSAKGVIVGINTGANTLTVIITNGLNKFAQGTGGDDITGPSGVALLTAVADAAPGASGDWSEELFNEVNGYPQCVEIHRGRILLGGAISLPSGLAGSGISNVYDFDVGTGGDADGFLETIGDSSAVFIKRLHSAEQLLLLTDRGPYYVPESTQNPFRPTSLAFNHFGGEWPCSDVYVGSFDGGVVYVSGSIIIKMSPTGNTSAMWDAQERSFLSPHVIKNPTDSFFVSNYAAGPERYGGFVNDDGTMAMMQLIDAEQVRNFAPWKTSGQYRSGCSIGGDIYMTVQRTVAGSTVYWIELFDDDLTLDGASDYATRTAMDAGVPALYGYEKVGIVAQASYFLGNWPPFIDDLPDGPYVVGFVYDRTIELLPPNIDDGGRNYAGEQMRITEVMVHTLESARFAVNGTELQAYRVTDPLDQPPPIRTGPQRIQLLGGWMREPTVTITQPDPLPLTVLGVGTKVIY